MRASRVRLAARAGDSRIRISAPRYATTGLPQPFTHAEGMTTFVFDVCLTDFTGSSFHRIDAWEYSTVGCFGISPVKRESPATRGILLR
ncbi:MAG: hypothetical protein Nkreftii_001117 [Candidatus Nitrospira kreftii]|uniref:Uncharacterized protein n=1 Tax=Candidatus Nitrospira kreftii TaxID=2652173 RepID=A0A7S8FCK3_9BACT|nr:MAG: hypothetical protein Nkreftii_001117 [Candidatus Nitrospira kreftii]